MGDKKTIGGRRRLRVVFTEAGGDHVSRVVGLLASPQEFDADILSRAAAKLFGRGCFWWAESSLLGYGQVVRIHSRPHRSCGNSAVLYRAEIELRSGAGFGSAAIARGLVGV